jgi:hypothetical protein
MSLSIRLALKIIEKDFNFVKAAAEKEEDMGEEDDK